MNGKKIATANRAIAEVLPEIRKIAEENQVRVQMRAVRFSDSASWIGDSQPVDIEHFIWTDQSAGGRTATAQALSLLCEALETEKMPQRRGVPPVCILLSDGYCTDSESDYDNVIRQLNDLPWGRKAIRLCIAIGSDESEYDEQQLLRFTNHPEVGVLKAHTPEALLQYIKWASVAGTRSASVVKGAVDNSMGTNAPLAPPPTPPPVPPGGEVF